MTAYVQQRDCGGLWQFSDNASGVKVWMGDWEGGQTRQGWGAEALRTKSLQATDFASRTSIPEQVT
jgi:hypothetical protein